MDHPKRAPRPRKFSLVDFTVDVHVIDTKYLIPMAQDTTVAVGCAVACDRFEGKNGIIQTHNGVVVQMADSRGDLEGLKASMVKEREFTEKGSQLRPASRMSTSSSVSYDYHPLSKFLPPTQCLDGDYHPAGDNLAAVYHPLQTTQCPAAHSSNSVDKRLENVELQLASIAATQKQMMAKQQVAVEKIQNLAQGQEMLGKLFSTVLGKLNWIASATEKIHSAATHRLLSAKRAGYFHDSDLLEVDSVVNEISKLKSYYGSGEGVENSHIPNVDEHQGSSGGISNSSATSASPAHSLLPLPARPPSQPVEGENETVLHTPISSLRTGSVKAKSKGPPPNFVTDERDHSMMLIGGDPNCKMSIDVYCNILSACKKGRKLVFDLMNETLPHDLLAKATYSGTKEKQKLTENITFLAIVKQAERQFPGCCSDLKGETFKQAVTQKCSRYGEPISKGGTTAVVQMANASSSST